MRFDWEPKPTPEGLLQIERNQRRAASDQILKEFTSQSSTDKSRSQWEESSQRKAQLVARILYEEQQQAESRANKDALSGPLPRNPPVAEILRQESEEKQAFRAAEKELAAQRREALLQQAAAIASTRESKREAQAQKNRLAALRERDPEVKEFVRKLREKELAREWEQQQKANRILPYEEVPTDDIKHTSLPGAQLGLTTHDKITKQEAVRAELNLQLEESQRRKVLERSEILALEAALQREWKQQEEAALQEEQGKLDIQHDFFKSVEAARAWQLNQASERAMAEAEVEKRLLADTKLRQQQDTVKDSNAKIRLREERERQLEGLKASKQVNNARNKAEKQTERLRLAQEAQKHVELLKEQTRRRQQQAQEILKVNEALIEADRARKQALVEENTSIRNALDEITVEGSSHNAAAKQAQRGEAVEISTQLAAQIAAKEVRKAALNALEKAHKEEERMIEEERKRLVTEAIAAYKILR
jgi:hypothetical protein